VGSRTTWRSWPDEQQQQQQQHLALVARWAADVSRLLQVVADFCAWSGMSIKREKSVRQNHFFF
jgi:hypothetical protein